MAKENPLAKRRMRVSCRVCNGEGNDNLLTLCMSCGGSGAESIVCSQCWTRQPPWRFRNKRNTLLFGKTCSACRERSSLGIVKDSRHGLPDRGELRVKLSVVSGNVKTGKIPVSMSSSPTCPTSCPHRGGACYAEHHFIGMHWRRLSAGAGITWDEFCEAIAALPEGQVWRHNEAGDLPGQGDEIDVEKLRQLVRANDGRAGFTYTHKEVLDDDGMAVSNRLAIMEANEAGFAVNLSADSLEHADALLELHIGPVAVTLSDDVPKQLRTPAGKPVTVCPAQWTEITCQQCQLCAKPRRKVIIGFWAHGQGKNKIGDSFQLPLFRAITQRRR